MESQEEKKIGIFEKILGKKNEPDFTAERAWIESTYGEGCYVPISERIKEKQNYIKSSIQTKFRHIYQNNARSFSSYHCVIDIEDDLAAYVETVFKPFIDNGFTIINLSDKVEEIENYMSILLVGKMLSRMFPKMWKVMQLKVKDERKSK